MAKTTCDWTVERLPWWANETLEEGEAERVAAHLDECAACREELAATRQAMALYAAHLPIETLLDLAQGGAGEARGGGEPGGVSRAAAEAHLGHCAECREELALLHESRAAVAAEPGEEGGKVTAFAPRRAAAPGAGGHRRFDRRALALAASVLLAVVAAGGWLSSHRAADERGERLAELERRLEAVTAEQEAVEPGAGEAGEGASADELAAAAERAAAERAAADRRIAELQAENAVLLAAARSDASGVGITYSWNLLRTRGDQP
ncbi:MAG TPA: zf-HC2 domain-containing protein, partial [Thermoanaerobaculia bacterium]